MSSILQADVAPVVEEAPHWTVFRVLSGRDAVLEQARSLEDLAGRCGQAGAMHGLAYLLDQEYAARKTPYLIRFDGVDGNMAGAVLLFEYVLGWWSTGFFSTGDSFGARTVIGPPKQLVGLAAEAGRVIVKRGGRMVLISLKQEDAMAALALTSTEGWSKQTRTVQDYLPLRATYEETLASLGKRTRTHLRYYRRRLEAAVPCSWVADVSGLIDPEDDGLLHRLNRGSLDPVEDATFRLQYRSAARLPGGFVSGLLGADGQWLGLVGGWRQDEVTWIQWQVNAAGHESASLGTVLRAYLIEQEVGRGMVRLAFHGGTSHPMCHAFPKEQVVDMVLRKPGALPTAVVWLVRRLYRKLPGLANRGNFLADALSSLDSR